MKRKIILPIIMIFMMLIMGTNITYAAKSTEIKTESFRPYIYESDYSTAFSMTKKIVQVITVVGVVISVVMLMLLGIKYMMGSVEEKAEYKKTMMPMFIGAILIFCSSTIVSIIYNIVSQIK